MRRGFGSILLGCAVALPCATIDGRATDLNLLARYHGIAKRNAFGLVPSNPQPVAAARLAETDWPPLKLSGMAAVGRRARAYFVEAEEGKPSRCFSVAEGQSHGAWKLLKVGLRSEMVWIEWHGAEVSLSLKTDAPVPQ